MTHDIDQDLRQALHRRAATTPHRPDLARAVIRHAHTIQRRRRVTGFVTALALVAVAVPLGIRAGDLTSRSSEQPQIADTPDPEPSGVTVQIGDLGELAEDQVPQVAYLEDSTLVVGEDRIQLGLEPAQVAGVAYAGGSAFFAVRGDTGGLDLRVESNAADWPDSLGPIQQGPWASADQRYVAWLRDGQIAGIDTETGDELAVSVGAVDLLRVVGFAGDTLYFAEDRSRDVLRRWTIGSESTGPVGGLEQGTAVSPDATLVADMVKVTDYGTCTEMRDMTTGDSLWETCDYRVLGFSPGGTYVWGADSYGDGFAESYNVILDARTGELAMRIDRPRRASETTFFMDSAFETEDTLLLLLLRGQQATIARCDVLAGECTRATPVADVPGDPLVDGLPFRLLSG
ncbi:MAG: hypothetical protein ACR2GM_13405 [Nocardioidaceae bacterium]